MLIPLHRRGFTLAEVAVALVLMFVVAGALYHLLATTQRLTLAQARQMNLQANVRAGALVVTGELRELSSVAGGSPAQNDVLGIAPSAITYRAMRGIGFTCGTSTATSVRIARSSFSGHRDPQAGRDTAYVLLQAGANTSVEDSWLPVAIAGVSAGTPCPGVAGPGITLTAPANASISGLENGTPVRISEVMELRLYQSDGKSWLGARSVSSGEVIQPLIGPLTPETGFRLEYLNATGEATTDRTGIKSIRVSIRGTSEDSRANGATLEEELVSQVTLRNAVRR